MKVLYLLGISLLCFSSLSAQKDIEGLWEGTITFGGIHSEDTHKFQLYLKSNGRKITGKTVIHLDEQEYIEMDVWGTWHGDRSVYMEEFNFVPVVGKEKEKQKPAFYRKYQFLHSRSIWESKLEGYWQEITPETFGEKRRRGKISLQRVKEPSKA
jgi:hypothetical protein